MTIGEKLTAGCSDIGIATAFAALYDSILSKRSVASGAIYPDEEAIEAAMTAATEAYIVVQSIMD